MINSSYANRFIEMLPEEIRLVQQAKSGDTNAFIKLYDVCVERVYRYIYFQVADDRVAEGLTFQVFFTAWKQLGAYKVFGLSFVFWLYSIARDQLSIYYRTHKKAETSETFKRRDFGEAAGTQTIRDALQLITEEEQQALILKFVFGLSNKNIARLLSVSRADVRTLQFHALQMTAGYLEETKPETNAKKIKRIFEECQKKLSNGTFTVDECLARCPQYAAQLAPLLRTMLSLDSVHDVTPSSHFKEYTRGALLHYIISHPRTVPHAPRLQNNTVFSWRMSYALPVLVMALLVTGTVHAQSALPDDTFYTWKRTSEQVWRAFSLNPVATDIALANRRLDELIAVANDPSRSVNAMYSYLEALAKLSSSTDAETLALIIPALELQQQTLSDVGLSVPDLDSYLDVAVVLLDDLSQVIPDPTAIVADTVAVPTGTEASTEVAPLPTDEVIPTETEIPTEIVPTETEIPTEIVPTETEIPTEIVPTETDVPTEIVPTETDVPTDIPPTDIPPTDVVPEATPIE